MNVIPRAASAAIFGIRSGSPSLYGIQSGQKTFIHLTSNKLTAAPWKKNKNFKLDGNEIWAPHIIEHDDK